MKSDYSQFMEKEIPKVRAANPDATRIEVFKIAAANWKHSGRTAESSEFQVTGTL